MDHPRVAAFFRLAYVGFALFFVLQIQVAQAQLCNGSLGDPVVNITFGRGLSPGPPLPASVTSYKYITTDCPDDGMYALRNASNNCWGSWHNLPSDHTGDPQGYFMLANATFAPGDFYVDTVRGLCGNTTYEFAAWLMNLVRTPNQIQPNVTFSIEKTNGTVLGMVQTGDIASSGSPQWKQYGLSFKTPPGIFEIVLRMRNNAPGGVGNDLALDDITFRPCGSALRSTIAGNMDTVNICEGDPTSFTLNANSTSFFSTPLYQWQLSKDSGQTWMDVPLGVNLSLQTGPLNKGFYWYRMTAAEEENMNLNSCRIASNSVVINMHGKPVVNAGPDKVVFKGFTAVLDGQISEGFTDFTWQPARYIANENTLSPTIFPDKDVIFRLSAATPAGCKASDDVFIKVVGGIYIPTSFTPNGDQVNDVWRIPYLQFLPDAEVWVFNRYGQMVYHSKNTSAEWDGTYHGKQQSTGVFIYQVKLKKDTPPLKGTLTLIR